MLWSATVFWTTLALAGAQAPDDDRDNDGLKDRWETEGFGPIDPKVHSVKPGRADVFILFRIRSTMTREKIQPTIDRVVKFYADLPNKNPDGSTGINAIPIVPPPMPKETDGLGYNVLYERAMPVEWRGFAHGIMVDDHPGGGGQANRPDWCGTGYNWQTMVHELGHQFGLDHSPKGTGTGSPFHTSLMNYDYSYQFNGDGNAIHYSTGKFSKMRMKENELNENVPYSATEVEFLSKRPYFFKIKPVDESKSMIDWNRNGIFGETGVKADVNDGYALEFRQLSTLDATAGTPALVSVGKHLALAAPERRADKTQPRSLSMEAPGEVSLRLIQDGKLLPKLVVDENATGDPSMAWSGGRLCLAYPTKSGITMRQYRVDGTQLRQVFVRQVPTVPMDVTVSDSGAGAVVLLRERGLGRIFIASFGNDQLSRVQLESKVPLGAAWNSKLKLLAAVEVVDQGPKLGRMRIAHLHRVDGKWVVKNRLWVEGESGNAATSDRPVILFDSSRDRGPLGAYNVYCKGRVNNPGDRAVNFVCRQIQDPSMGDGWRIRMMGNEWAISQNPPSATLHNGDVAYVYRLGFSDNETKLVLAMQASGVEDKFLDDMDEVGYVTQRGLRESLQAVQKERGIQSP